MGRNPIKRREFLEKSALGFAVAATGVPAVKKTGRDQEIKNKIITRKLGRTGLELPVVSFGVMNTYSPDMLHKALEMGIKHFDTAHGYLRGNSERYIGQVIEESGMRDKVIIATKMYFNRDRETGVFLTEGGGRQFGATQEDFNEQLKISLERLRTEYVDILYLHSCYTPEMVNFEPMMDAFVKAKKEGIARFIGVTTHANEPAVIRAAVDAGIYDVIEIGINYWMKDKEEIKKAAAYAAGKDIGIVAMKTVGGNDMNKEKSADINHKAALKWVLSDKSISTAIPGMTTFAQMDLNWSIMDEGLTLTEADMADLERADKGQDSLFCQGCRSCLSTCRSLVYIPNLMRAFMYAQGYGNLIQAEMTVEELPQDKGLAVCRACSSCTAVCQNGYDIKQRIGSLISMGFGRP
ncbi:MAG: aldo/keto reductase [Candidatus Aminicenantes bacterium]|nr:aldo/keto reductase [Candidatus Aminicenantes bacterium]